MGNSNNNKPAGSKCTHRAMRNDNNPVIDDAFRIRQLEDELKTLQIELQSRIDHLKITNQELEKRLTQCIHTEQTLVRTEERIHSIVNTAADAIISISDTGVIEHFNMAAEKMFGYSTDEAIGSNINILMPSPYREHHKEYLARYQETNQSSVMGLTRETVARHKSGKIFPIELSVSEVDHHKFYTGIIRDLSGRKKLEQELLTIADRAQRDIGQNLHDDISQEMTGLILKTEALQDTVSQQDTAAQTLIEDIISGMDRTRGKISVLAKGLIPVAVDSRGLNIALEELSTEISAVYNISCTLSASKNVSITNNSVATQLYHIAQEAITNAIRHGKAQNIQIKLNNNNNRFILCVQDDGIGFPLAGAKGSGMGLHIMKYRTRLFGGKLDIQPGETGGVIVTCTFYGENENGTSC